jgi:hypothetical protein
MTNSDSVDDPFLAQVEGGLSGRRLVDSAFGELRILIDGSFLKPGGGAGYMCESSGQVVSDTSDGDPSSAAASWEVR